MTNDAMVAHVIVQRLGRPTPDIVDLDEMIDVIAAVMDAFGLEPEDEFVPPEMA